MITRFFAYIRQERLAYLVLALLGKIFEQVLGRGFAQLLGWRDGYVGHGSRVIGSAHITVGDKAHICRYAWIEAVSSFRGQSFTPAIQIGRGFSASDRLHISCVDGIQIGENCLFGSGVYISDHNHGVYQGVDQSTPLQAPVDRELRSTGTVRIGSNVWLGDNVIIVGPVVIGNGVVIGANSVVKQDVPENIIAAGSPLRKIKQFNLNSGKWELYEG